MSRKKNTNWKRTVKKQAGREEMQGENRRGLLCRLSPEARPAPPSPPAIAAAIPGVITETSKPDHAGEFPGHSPKGACDPTASAGASEEKD
jgi:hypothetical protein